jgi:hypothetical protein
VVTCTSPPFAAVCGLVRAGAPMARGQQQRNIYPSSSLPKEWVAEFQAEAAKYTAVPEDTAAAYAQLSADGLPPAGGSAGHLGGGSAGRCAPSAGAMGSYANGGAAQVAMRSESSLGRT